MKRITFLLVLQFLLLNLQSSFAQGGTWTWISGTNHFNMPPAGIKGIPSVSNHPPGMYEPAEWKDKEGNLWLYGGCLKAFYFSDLWKYNPATKEWTWVNGNGQTNQKTVYGTKGVADDSNTPGPRPLTAVTWVDTSGALWLFGGFNCSNDLWKYDISLNQWTWMTGDSIANAGGVHGAQGIPGPANTPGSRWETCSAWTDSLNNLWLFGGWGYDDNHNIGYLDDLCKYDINTNEWTWMKGSAYINAGADYGIRGVADTSNDPGGRWSYTKWKDAQNNFWLMGGNNGNSFNDVWKYDLSLNEWTWMNGADVGSDTGRYDSKCSPDTLNLPYSRFEERSAATDNCSRFWLFGGGLTRSSGYLNDLWVFDPQQLAWKWISGTNIPDQQGNYGSLGVPSPSNIPSSRSGAVAWWGNDNKFYLFGGTQYNNGWYYSDMWAFNPDTNCVPVCAAAIHIPPVADFQSGRTTICANDCIDFTDKSANATSWQWYFAGALDSTSVDQNPQNICYSAAGIYDVALIASNAAGRNSITFVNYIKVNAAPPSPLLTQQQETLYCSNDSSYTSYQWSIDSTIIAGATDTSLVVDKSGNYNMQVTNKNGCKSATGINIVLGIQNYADDHIISFSPNPAKEKLTIYDLRFTIGLVEIYNVLGQVCSKSDPARAGVNHKYEMVVDVSSLSPGVYFVQITTEKARWSGKFIKE